MTVIDLEMVRVRRVAQRLAEELQTSGVVRIALDEVDDVDRWRRAARHAGRDRGWRIRTGVSGIWAWAVSEDWQPGPGADRRAAHLVGSLIAREGLTGPHRR